MGLLAKPLLTAGFCLFRRLRSIAHGGAREDESAQDRSRIDTRLGAYLESRRYTDTFAPGCTGLAQKTSRANPADLAPSAIKMRVVLTAKRLDKPLNCVSRRQVPGIHLLEQVVATWLVATGCACRAVRAGAKPH